MVNILVFSKHEAYKHFPSSPTIAIRCMSSSRNRSRKYQPLVDCYYVGILPLVFDDIRDLKNADLGVVFQERHAERIRKFVESKMGKFEELMVHCDAGASRSVAVASALGDHYGWKYDGEILVRREDGRNPIVYERLINVLKK